MANLTPKGRKIIKWLLTALAALVVVLGVVVACNWENVKVLLQVAGVLPTPAATDISTLLDELEDTSSSAVSILEEDLAPTPDSTAASEPASEAESEAEQEPESSAQPPEETEQPASTAAPAVSASSTAATPTPTPPATPAATPTPTPALSPTATPSSTPESTAPTYQQQLDEQIQALKAMEKEFESRLYGIMWEAFDEYMALPQSSQNLFRKGIIIASKAGTLTSMEKECDQKVAVILAEMRRILTENGQSTSLADEAEKAYKAKKSSLKTELLSQANSGGDGSGQSGNWLSQHAPKS